MSQPVGFSSNQVSSKSDEELEGLSDGAHNLLSCSNCNAILMDIWVTRPHETDTYKVRASCPWCNDRSFIMKITGGFHMGGYGTLKGGDDPDETVESTLVDEFVRDEKTNVFEFKIGKATKDAKPVFK